MMCFECNQRIDGKYFDVGGYRFHWACVRKIIEAHIADRLEREAAYDHQALNEDTTVEELADRLDYKPFSPLTWLCVLCGTYNELNDELAQTCWKCHAERKVIK